MAMDADVLTEQIKLLFYEELATSNPTLTALILAERVNIDSLIDAMASACARATVAHIQTLASVTVTVASVTGVTTGA